MPEARAIPAQFSDGAPCASPAPSVPRPNATPESSPEHFVDHCKHQMSPQLPVETDFIPPNQTNATLSQLAPPPIGMPGCLLMCTRHSFPCCNACVPLSVAHCSGDTPAQPNQLNEQARMQAWMSELAWSLEVFATICQLFLRG